MHLRLLERRSQMVTKRRRWKAGRRRLMVRLRVGEGRRRVERLRWWPGECVSVRRGGVVT